MSDDKHSLSRAYDALNSRGLSGKREYVRGLEQRRDEEALSLLVECLCDESWYLREQAEEALLRIGERATPVLLPLLEQGLWFTRVSTARVLGRFARRDAIAPLLRLTEDANETVADAARDALVAIGRSGGSFSLARALHGQPPDLRKRRFDDVSGRDRALGERVDRLLRNDDLMAAEGGDLLADDSPIVRGAEEGLEWEVLTGPATTVPRSKTPETGRGDAPAS